MFKNNVFRDSVDTKKWIINAGIRAIKTFCQSLLSLLVVGQAIQSFNWLEMLSISATAGVISILTSIAGIPEVESSEAE